MTTPDTDDDLKNLPGGDAEHDDAGDAANQPPEDSSDARSDEAGDIPSDAGDGNAVPGDPLLLAQQTADEEQEPPKAKPATKPATAPAKPATEPKAAAAKVAKTDAPADDNPTPDDKDQDADLTAALADMPKEDWTKLSHKGRSTILAQRRVVRTAQAAVKQATDQAAAARKDYEEVDRFRQDNGLDADDWMKAVSLGGAIKSGNKDVIPFLEQTLAGLRKHHGIADAAPAATEPQIDADKMASLVERAESYDLEAIAELKQLAAGLKAKKPAKPAPAAAPAPVVERREPAPVNGGANNADDAEFKAVFDSLVGAGVAEDQVGTHLAELLKELSGGKAGNLPKAGERVRKVMEAHWKRSQKAPAVPAKPATRPLSGRGGPVSRSGPADPTQPVDPMKHAIRR